MAGKITQLTSIPAMDRTADLLEIVDISAGTSNKTTVNNMLGFSGGNPVSTTDTQTITNKTLTAPTLTSPILSGTVTGTYTLAGTPTFPATVVTTTGSQTLTNKILTSPTISSPTITNASITTDSISGFSSSNTGTIFGMAVTSSVLPSSALPTGTVVQIQTTNFTALATGSTLIPIDDTIPQITEGTEFMTQAITPKSATNILIIEVHAYVTNSVGVRTVGALYQDSTANALAVVEASTVTATYSIPHLITYSMVAGTTSSTTFRYRAGGESAGTLTFNGISGARFFGATSKSFMKITEVKG